MRPFMRKFAWLCRITDTASLWLAIIIAFHLRFTSGLIPVYKTFQDFSLYFKTVLFITPLYIFLMSAMGNYHERHGRINQYEAQNILRSLAFFYLVSAALTFLFHDQELSRITIVLSFFANLLLCLLFRKLLSLWQIKQWRNQNDRIRLLLIGRQKEFVNEVAEQIESNSDLGFELLQPIFVDQEHSTQIPFEKLDRIIIVGGDLPFSRIADIVLDAPSKVRIDFIPSYHLFLRNVPAKEYIGTFPVLPINHQLLSDWNSFAKKLFDISLSAICLLLMSPILVLTCVCIYFSYGSPILFRQLRVGQNGRLFTMYKFRTMKIDAHKEVSPIIAEQQQTVFKWKDDPRVENALARFLRKTGLDELPQLWNVLQGEMSFVGPRPATLELVRNYSAEHKLRLTAPPGITGLQQVQCRGTNSMEEILKYDMQYLAKQNIWLDCIILLKTVRTLLSGQGIS